MANGTKAESTRAATVQTLVETVGPHAAKVMAAAAAVGLVAVLLPAATLTITLFGTTTSESLAVYRDWRGKLDVIGYIGVGVMAGLLLRTPDAPAAKKLSTACLVTAGLALLLAVWLPLSIRGGSDVPAELGRISVGFGCYLNILASLALAAGAALQARRTNVF